ncbi:Polyadenylate-binding protein-interacting protein 10 [Zea mays]|uniref:Polyadenylate-binding protein-interacting protein 10 n=1 Tax=Zea mays TaxID=4577 RepID=A0A3L6EU40_MAIZE|nr:Polyadenylate-binding protein-interacting protein 10 [Zea mays]
MATTTSLTSASSAPSLSSTGGGGSSAMFLPRRRPTRFGLHVVIKAKKDPINEPYNVGDDYNSDTDEDSKYDEEEELTSYFSARGNQSHELAPVTEENLAALFINCGQVVGCRMCGDPNSVLRFAFIEFTDEEGARAALNLSGTVLRYYPVRVLP